MDSIQFEGVVAFLLTQIKPVGFSGFWFFLVVCGAWCGGLSRCRVVVSGFQVVWVSGWVFGLG